MSKLSKDWLTEQHIDLELKQYVLLAYLQEVKESYKAAKIYPYLGDLIEHYKNLLLIKQVCFVHMAMEFKGCQRLFVGFFVMD